MSGLIIGSLTAVFGIATHVTSRLEALGVAAAAILLFTMIWLPMTLRLGLFGRRLARFRWVAVDT